MPDIQPQNHFIDEHRKAIEAVAAHIGTLWAPVSIFGEPDASIGKCLGCFESGQIFVVGFINGKPTICCMQDDDTENTGRLVAWLPFPTPFKSSEWRWGTNAN